MDPRAHVGRSALGIGHGVETYEGRPRWSSLIARALRAGAAPIPVYRWVCFKVSPGHAGRAKDKVAAGVNPAAPTTLEVYGGPGWSSLIARALRAGAAPIPVCRWVCLQGLLPATQGDVKNKAAAGMNPAANATLVVSTSEDPDGLNLRKQSLWRDINGGAC